MEHSIPQFTTLQFGSLFCIGRNYAKHAAEMNSEITDEPVVFLKPRSSIIFNNDSVQIPTSSINVHHEVELVLLIGKECENISKNEALNYVKAYSIGLDITARDIQSNAKKEGLPWTLAKGFNTFAPIGNFVQYQNNHNFNNLDLSVSVNGEIRQQGNTSDMIFSAAEIISYLSHNFTLYPGDLIFTGTPEGVSPIKKGDKVHASLNSGESTLNVSVDA